MIRSCNKNRTYFFPLATSCKKRDNCLRNADAVGKNGGVVDELVSTKLERKECRDE